MRRSLVSVLTLGLLLGLPAAGIAQDEPKEDPLKAKVVVHPAEGTVYLYRFTETSTMKGKLQADGRDPSEVHQRCEATWELELRLAEVKDDGSVVLALTPTRVSGTYESQDVPERTFDSSTQGVSRSMMLARQETKVTLSADGRVTDVQGRAAEDLDDDSVHEKSDIRRARVERFFQSLPAGAPRSGASWETPRWASPDFVLSGQHLLGDLEEKTTVRQASATEVTAQFKAKGSNRIAKRKLGSKPPTPGPKAPPQGSQLESWDVSGEVTIQRETGLCSLRTAHGKVKTWFNIWARPPEIIGDHEYTWDSKLELVGTK